MSQAEREKSIQRILVALDASPASFAALQAAAELAADFGAELVGLFVEDVNLLRIAEISFTQEVGFFSATSRRLEIRHVQRQFRSQASRAKRALRQVAEKVGVNWSFQVVRGVIAAELLTAASEADLVILGRMGWSATGRKRLGSTARAMLSQGTQLTLLLQPGILLSQPFLAVYNGSVVSQKALAIAAQLLPEHEGRLTVLILAEDQETAQRLQQEAKNWLEPQNLQARYLWRSGVNVQDLARMVQTEQYQTLVLPGSSLLLSNETILELLDRTDCSVLLVR
jgi:nucleotide-binding universal stress UspA family protein